MATQQKCEVTVGCIVGNGGPGAQPTTSGLHREMKKVLSVGCFSGHFRLPVVFSLPLCRPGRKRKLNF